MPPDQNQLSRRPLGFVNPIQGTLTLDSDAVVFNSSSDTFVTLNHPETKGEDGGAYDTALQRWLPTTAALVSADGSEFIYQDQSVQAIHLVQVAAGADRVVLTTPDATALALTSGSMVVVIWHQDTPDPNTATGQLESVDLDTGAQRQLASSSIQWRLVTQNAVYGVDLNPADPSPLIQSPIEPAQSRAPDRVWRESLSGGPPVQWMYRPGALVEVAGVDTQDRVIAVVVRIDRTEVWALTAPETGTMIFHGPGYSQADSTGLNSFGLAGPGITDSHGLWFATPKAIFRIDSAGTVAPVYLGQAMPAGPCS